MCREGLIKGAVKNTRFPQTLDQVYATGALSTGAVCRYRADSNRNRINWRRC